MKISAFRSSDATYAQIKPVNRTVFYYFFEKLMIRIGTLILFSVVFFISTSYMSQEKASEFLNQDLNSREMHVAITGYFSACHNTTVKNTTRFSLERMVIIFYQSNAFMPAWTLNNSVTPAANSVINLLSKAPYYGLDPDAYNVQEIQRLRKAIEESSDAGELVKFRKEFELQLTRSCLAFMVNLREGFIDLDSVPASLHSFPYYLSDIIRAQHVDSMLLTMQPVNISYVYLQRALEKYISHANPGTDANDRPDLSKESGMSVERTVMILTALGYISPEHKTNDSIYIRALMQFQIHNGLTPNGKLNKNTREALSSSTRERYERIALNLDRMRKEIPEDHDYVFVNIPAYELRVIKNNKIMDRYNVVVGKPLTPTPELSSKIEDIVANPRWNVPRSITVNEILPRVIKDSSYLLRNNFKIIDKQLNEVNAETINWENTNAESFDYYFVQNSGNSNALGTLKFTFRNPYNVYIHDTPSKKYFAYDIRAYSHGCIRLQNPEKFAQYLIENYHTGENTPDIHSLLSIHENREIELSEPVNIHIRYFTVEADENLNIHFYKDIYGKDKESIIAMMN